MINIGQLRATAIHEAGHAIAASRLAIPVTKVEILSDTDRMVGGTDIDLTRVRLVDWVAFLLSGNIAERAILGYETPEEKRHPCSDAAQIINAIAKTMRNQQIRAMADQKARRLVMAHRPAILGLAGALLDRALAAGGPWAPFEISVSGDDLIALLGGDELAILRLAVNG